MDMSTDEQNWWRLFTDPHGRFHVEVPTSWHVEQSEGAFTHSHQGHVWQGRRYFTHLLSPGSGSNVRRMSLTIRIEQFAETPPPITGDLPEPTDLKTLRAYRIAHDSDWLTCIVGYARVHIQYEIQGVSGVYHAVDWEPPAALSPDERRRRLALVQRIIDSFDLFAPDGDLA